MNWDKLRIFHAVAEAGSFTHAGEHLKLSQSAISRHISSLEENLGVKLFHRHARGLILTEQGEMLHKTSRDMSQKLATLQGRLMDSRKRPEGPLAITVSDFIGTTWLVPKLQFFRRQYPDIQLTLLLDDRVLNLGMREADVAIRLHRPEAPDLIQRLLTTVNFHMCGSKRYFDRYGKPESIQELKKHTLIAHPENSYAPYPNPNWIFQVAGVSPEHNSNIIMMNSLYAIHRAVVTAAGIAALPDYLIKNDSRLEVVLPDIKRPGVDMYFVYAEERRNSQRINLFREFLLKNIHNTPFTAEFI